MTTGHIISKVSHSLVQKFESTDHLDQFFSYSDIPWVNITLNVFTWLILSIGLFDFILQTGAILFSLVSCLSQPLKVSKRIFGCLIVIIFLFIRLTVLAGILDPVLVQVFEGQPWIYQLQIAVTSMIGLMTAVVFLPGLFCAIFYTFKYGIRAKKSTKTCQLGQEPMVAIVMPIYNEAFSVLIRAIDSIFAIDYPANKIHFFLSFDDSDESELYFQVLTKLGILTPDKLKAILESTINNNTKLEVDPLFPARIDTNINGIAVTVSRFPHGGKGATQGHTFRLIQNLYSEIKDSTYILHVDSDIILHANAVHNFVANAHANPNFIAGTGLLTCSTQFKVNIYQYLQNAEYVTSLFMRSAEAGLGAVTCLPGAMTFVKMTSLEGVSDTYFYREKEKDLSTFRHHRETFGEDRYLTYLLTKNGTHPYQIAFVPNAISKTDAPDTFMTLLKQRRRWLLAAIACETYQLTSPEFWKRLPFNQIYRLFLYQSASLIWVAWVKLPLLITGNAGTDLKVNWAFLFLTILVILKYIFLCIFCLLSRRKKVCFYCIVLIPVLPLFTLVTVVYMVFTWNVRSWGGPRADSKTKDDEANSKIDLITKVLNDLSKTRNDFQCF